MSVRLEFYATENLKRQILEIVARYLDLAAYRVFFFGSRVAGKGSEWSDIDVGIEGPSEIPYEIMARIREDIENLPTLYTIDIVDFKKVTPEFKEEALRSIEAIWQPT